MRHENLTTITGSDQAAAIDKAIRQLAAVTAGMLGQRDRLTVGWAAGRSIEHFATALRGHQLAWPMLECFMLDERRVALDHPDSNFGMLNRCLFGPLVADRQMQNRQLHPFCCTSDQPLAAAVAGYTHELSVLAPSFDIVIASMGEDGHIASLFPHHPALMSDAKGYIAVDDAPKPPPARLSASPLLIQSSRSAFLFAWGEDKRSALRCFFDQGLTPAQCPAQLLWQIPELYLVTNLVDPHGSPI